MPAKVKLSSVLEQLDSPSEEFRAFFNCSTGEVVVVSNDQLSRAEDGEEDVDSDWGDEGSFQEALAIIEDEDEIYVELPDQYEIDEYSFMEEFCFEIPEGPIRKTLLEAINGKGAFRRFKEAVREFEMEDRWYAFREQKLKEIALEWCEENQIQCIDDVSSKNGEPPKKAPGTKPNQSTAGRKSK